MPFISSWAPWQSPPRPPRPSLSACYSNPVQWMSSCSPGLWGFPDNSVSAPCLRHLFFPCHCSVGKSQLILLVSAHVCPPLTPADGCPSRRPSLFERHLLERFFRHKVRPVGCSPHRPGPSRGQRRTGAPGRARGLSEGVRGSVW